MNYLVRVSFCFMSVFMYAQQSFVLPRVTIPDSEMLQQQRYDQLKRKVSKYFKGVSATVGLGTILYFAYQVHQHAVHQEFNAIFLEQEKRSLASDKKRFEGYLQQIQTLSNLPDVDANGIPDVIEHPEFVKYGLLQQMVSNLKSFGLSSSKFVADSILLIVSGSVANYVYDFMKTKINQAFCEETVFWYISEHTKLSWLFSDLKTYAVDYDVYASVLSAEMFNQDAQIHMKALLKDLHQVVIRSGDADDFHSSAYWNYLFDEIKKKYIKKSSNFENRQDFVDMALIKQHRIVQDQDGMFLFVQDMNRRYAMVQLCNYLVLDMQQLIGFITLKIQNHATSDNVILIQELVEATNKFLEYMQMLLNMPLDELTVLSKQDKGIFTAVYEFEKIFNEQMSFLHRYCKYSR